VSPVARADESTRDRMLAAAVRTILEEGYYRASSNRIAERAGVTWGVIQYHFGTREQLLLAVVRDGADELVQLLADATITGDTVEQRVDSLAEVIWSHYRRPELLAQMQILLNLGRDPRTSADTVAALAEGERQVGALWQRLIDQVVPGRAQRADLGPVIFEIIRGVALGAGLIEAIPHGRVRAPVDPRPALVRALTLLVEDQ
jgi:AcrR family transcriptional regulator